MSKYIIASHVPLFDRFQGSYESSLDGRILDINGLRSSISLELSRLFNVRNSLSINEYLSTELTVLQYGLPDLLTLSVQSVTDLDLLSAILKKALECFEPRLFDITINSKPNPKSLQSAVSEIFSSAYLGRQTCHISFNLSLNSHSAVLH